MQSRVLVFDPDIEGRRLIRAALDDDGLGLTLIMRATSDTASKALRSLNLDGVIIGLPVELPDLAPLLLQLQSIDHPPPMFFLQEQARPEAYWLTKDEAGLRRLRTLLIPAIRAHKLGRAVSSLYGFLNRIEGSARSHLANQITDLLETLDIPAMYASVDRDTFRWDLRSSNFPPGVASEVIAITDSHGGVAPHPATLKGALKELFTGAVDDHTFELRELLPMLVPGADPGTLRRLEDLLAVEAIHIVAIRTEQGLNGYLLLGHRPQEAEREAFLKLGKLFGKLLVQAQEYDLLNQQARSMRVLQEVMLSLSATLDPSDLLETVLQKLERVVPFDFARIALYEDDQLLIHAGRGDLADFEIATRLNSQTGSGASVVAALVEQDGPVLFDTPGQDTWQDRPAQEQTYGSWIGVPISWRGDKLGYLLLASKRKGALEAIHLEISLGFARQLAIALQNARLLQNSSSRAEKLRLVNDIGRYAISVLDPQQLAEEVAWRVREVFGYYAVRILLVEGSELVPYSLSGGEEHLSIGSHKVIALEDVREISEAVQQDRPVYLNTDSPRWREVMPARLTEARAAVLIPLSVVSEVIGIMEVYAKSAEVLGQEDVDTLKVLAAQIAISVVNARLFNEIRSHAVELESRVELRTQELQSQKERTEAILRSVADAVLVLDLNGEVVLANPPGQELLVGEQGKVLYKAVRALFVAEGVVQSSLEIGGVTYQALASPVDFEGQAQGTVVVLRDITRLKELDQLKNQFVATVSHELRTPLTNIKLYLSLLRSAGDEKRARYHKVLVQETERLSDMIEDLLDLSRLESQGILDKEEVSLVDLLQMVADNHEPACINKGVRFSTDLTHRPTILADRAQMIQVFTNLLSNAIAYTPVGGEISLRVAGTEQVESREYAKIVLQDTGIGIRKEDLPHVFDRFYRGAGAQKYKAEGSGLGLAIVREILDNHDAKVAVDSQPGEGTKFTVWLPTPGE